MKFWELTIFCFLTMLVGILGFYLAVNLLTPSKETTTFFEITFSKSKKHAVERLLKSRITKLDSMVPELSMQIMKLGPEEDAENNGVVNDLSNENLSESDVLKIKNKQSKSPRTNTIVVNDSIKIKRNTLKRKFEIAESTLNRSVKELNGLLYYNKDTSINYYVDYLWIDRKELFNRLSDNDLDIESKQSSLKFYLIDTSLVSILEDEILIKDSIYAEVNKHKSKVTFINKYPIFGFWLVFSIGQMTIWFIVVMVIIGITINTIIKVSK